MASATIGAAYQGGSSYNPPVCIRRYPALIQPPSRDRTLSVSHRSNRIVSALVAGLCMTSLGCEPDRPPHAEPAPQAPTPATSAPQAPALHELDAVARTVDLTPSKLCNLEFLDGIKFGGNAIGPKDLAATEFHGWVGDETTGARPTGARLRFVAPNHQRAWESPVGPPVVRRDVSKNTKIPTLENAGFRATADLRVLPPGEYRVYLVFSGPNGSYRCDNGRRLVR